MSQMQHSMQEVITNRILPEFLERFINKSLDYRDAWKLLGTKGQFSDINRKFWKLYNAVWLDQELVGEQPYEIVEDIVGHCLILLYIMQREPTSELALFSYPPTGVGATVASSDTLPLAEDDPRCAATKDLGGSLVRCDLYRGHPRSHLGDSGTIQQYQWKDDE